MRCLIALIGSPNSGKTTLYNWLTNSKFKTVNYPGATVEYSIGNLVGDENFQIMDTPGTYSLFPKSADEEITLRALYEQKVNKVILVVDGTQMTRQLLLAEQLQEAGFSFVIALTMSDLLLKKDIRLDVSVIEKQFNSKVILIDGLLGGGIEKLITQAKLASESKPTTLNPWSDDVLASKQLMLESLVKKTLQNDSLKKLSSIYNDTAKIDRFLMHPFFGLVIFFTLMFSLFSSIFWLAKPFMDLVDNGFTGLKNIVIAISPNALWTDFLGNGVISSFGAVLVFVPQIFILFLGIGLLENSGYLARAATLIDKPFSKLGMSGRSFVPVLSGFACAVPAMMASRNISSTRDRLITNFIIPLLTCSARLPVYALLLSFIFKDSPAWKAGLTLALIYFGSLILGSLAAAILNKFLAKTEKSFFMMELPLYRKPQWKTLVRGTINRTKAYVQRAGPMIFTFAVIIWLGTTFPNYKEVNQSTKLQTSYLGKVGHVMEPVFLPMGVDWRVGVGFISAFAAREVFVGSMAIMFNITEENQDSQAEGLLKTMQEAKFSNGTPIFTLASVIGIIVFFMIALQCMSTFAIAVREQGKKFALQQLIIFNIVAYVLAVLVVNGLRAIGVA